jgi:hypothetical protein
MLSQNEGVFYCYYVTWLVEEHQNDSKGLWHGMCCILLISKPNFSWIFIFTSLMVSWDFLVFTLQFSRIDLDLIWFFYGVQWEQTFFHTIRLIGFGQCAAVSALRSISCLVFTSRINLWMITQFSAYNKIRFFYSHMLLLSNAHNGSWCHKLNTNASHWSSLLWILSCVSSLSYFVRL